jgi:hypothetical protein
MDPTTSPTPVSRRAEALVLAEQLLEDVELARLAGIDIARRALRLARLLDDGDAVQWLQYEVAGYPTPLDDESVQAAERSGRRAIPAEDGKPRWWTNSLTEMETQADTAIAQIGGLSSSGTSSADVALLVERDKLATLAALRTEATTKRGIRDRVVGALHTYVARRYDELRFGASVESAFEVVRADVDSRIGDLVPNALGMLAAAFENIASTNPEHWANAASTCRRLLKEAADVLRPPGDPLVLSSGKTIQMGPDNYVNRLVAWIEARATSETTAQMVGADLEYLGRRLDAANDAGHKGAHASVDRIDASRFIVGTYLVLGDILRWPH